MASLFHLPSSLAFPNINHSPFSSNSIKASHSHFRISIRNENLPPILSKISEFSSKTLNFLLSGSLALALSLTEEGRKEDDGIKEGSGDDVSDDVEGKKEDDGLKEGSGDDDEEGGKEDDGLNEGPGDDVNDDEEEEKEDEE
ncbi:hypothetical protein CQW23_24099 [Capsicum baccatum]|uniref:Uncharacterized protein n=1 Tax=Capsicum baccatum TaxID=33114 RepID=A0A2G2VTT1_CAPBA|nr:hypothetical protein CQW23_24099 [Capsicum baccatum]